MMAESKKSFVLYCDLIHTVEHLPNDKAGELFKHILSYVNDRDPVTDCIVVKLAFEPIRQQLKRDLSKWDEIKEKRRIAGLASAEAKRLLAEQSATNSTHVESVEHTSTNSTVSVNVNDTVNVNGTVSVKSQEAKVSPEKGNATPTMKERIAKANELVIPYLNEKAGTAFKADSKATQRLIAARVKEGYGWKEFTTVIDSKVDAWGKDPKMCEFIRPSTLFGTKFEEYLNAHKVIAVEDNSFKPRTETYSR